MWMCLIFNHHTNLGNFTVLLRHVEIKTSCFAWRVCLPFYRLLVNIFRVNPWQSGEMKLTSFAATLRSSVTAICILYIQEKTRKKTSTVCYPLLFSKMYCSLDYVAVITWWKTEQQSSWVVSNAAFLVKIWII